MSFDLGFMQSYVSPYFASNFVEQPILLDHLVWISTLMRESLMVQLVFQPCVVSINGVNTLADLMVLEMIDFGIILGMDWLALCHAIVDYYSKSVRFDVLDRLSFVIRGDNCLIPSMSALHFINKEVKIFLLWSSMLKPKC